MKIEQEGKGKIRKGIRFLKENPDLKFSDISVDELERKADDLDALDDEYAKKSVELFDIERKRDELYSQLNEFLVRLNKIASGYFGLDSTKVKERDLKTKSEKKRYTRKTQEEIVEELERKTEAAKAKLLAKKEKPEPETKWQDFKWILILS